MPAAAELPPVRRASFHEALRDAVKSKSAPPAGKGDPEPPGPEEYRALVMGRATELAPLHQIQLAYDQLARKAEDHRNGEPDPYQKTLAYHADQADRSARFHADVLKAASDAAEAMIAAGGANAREVHSAMSKQKPEDKPAAKAEAEAAAAAKAARDKAAAAARPASPAANAPPPRPGPDQVVQEEAPTPVKAAEGEQPHEHEHEKKAAEPHGHGTHHDKSKDKGGK
jgi:hypothetical protein